MKKRGKLIAFAGTMVLASTALLFGGKTATPADETPWPTKDWATASPASVGIDEQVLLRLDKDMASGKYSALWDSFAVFCCGKKVFERTYPRDYAKIYGKEAGERGPWNMRLTGRYNYFDPYWHPYYHGTDLHTMQSVSKTVTSIIIGVAMQRGDFKAGLETSVLKYFDVSKVKNVDDRKRRMTLRDLLTLSSGLEWNADGFQTGDPKNDTSVMEGSDDWVQYAIDKPMAAEPGKVWNYNDGAAVLLGYIFQKETGQDIDDYAQKYLFAPMGIRHEWKRTYLGAVDTEGGLYLNGSDLAKIGYLYLHDGMWDGQQIVSSEWVKKSVTPYFQMPPDPDYPDGLKDGYMWWLTKLPDSSEYVWTASGFGGQHLEVFPQEDLIVTRTAWDFLPSSTGTGPTPSDFLALVKTKTCPGTTAEHQSTSEKQQVSKQGAQNPEAYELYLRGRSYWAKRTRADLETAASYFNQAIAKDPGYAMAYAALADTYAVMPDYGGSPSEDIPKSKAAARKALELDATLSRPHAVLGYIKMGHEWDFAGGEAEFKRALELDPNDATAHAWYAENIGMIGGREQEALAEINRAHELDPLSAVISHDLGTNLMYARRYDEAIAVCKKLANENPTFALAHSCLSDAYWAKRMYPQSLEEYKVASQLSGDRNDSELAAAMEQGFRSAGWKGALHKGIEAALAERKTGYSSAYTIATMYAGLGEKDQAFRWLNTSYQERDTELLGLRTDSSFDPIRSDPRFAELVRRLGLPQAGKQGTQNPEAYALYLKGRSYWAKRTRADLETAASYFNQAIAKDPGYAMAYAGLADCYAMLPDYGASEEDIPKAKAAALKAIELDPTLSRPHVNLGGMKMAHEWDFAGGEAEFKKALELDPNDSHAHQRYADNLGLLGGREQEALAEINRAHQLDPLSLAISVDLGNVHTYARRFDEAIVVCKKVADENPTFAGSHDCLANAYWGKKMYPQVIEEWKAYSKLTAERSDSDYAAALEQGFRSRGWKGALTKSIETMKEQRKTGYSVTYNIAEAYADLGDKEQAFQWLNIAYQEHDIGLMGLKTDFMLDSLRSDPRFAELVRKVGLPQ